MWRHDLSRTRGAVTVGLLLTVLTACAGTSQLGSAASNTVTGSASLGDLTQAYLAYAQCARTHGLPDLPDPVVDQHGNDSYPPLVGSPRWPASVLTGCASVWDHVHQVRAMYDASHALAARAHSTMSRAQLLAFARCIRQHGFPNFPDPSAGGPIPVPLPQGFTKPNLSQAAIAAIRACTVQVSHG